MRLLALIIRRRAPLPVPAPLPPRGDWRDYPTLPMPVYTKALLAARAAENLAEQSERLGWTSTDALATGRMGGA